MPFSTCSSWVSARRRYLFPGKVLSRLFRGKFLAALECAYDEGRLDLGGLCAPLNNPDTFAAFKHALYSQEWVVYSKPTFAGANQVFAYYAEPLIMRSWMLPPPA
jgi:hypothetical protein